VLDDQLATRARKRAAARGITFSALVNEALRAALAPSAAPVARFEMLAFGESSPAQHLDPSDMAALVDEEDAAGARR